MGLINNKYLNSKPVYELPEGTEVALYIVSKGSNFIRGVNFKEDLSINARYDIRVLESKHPTVMQVLVKSDDNDLLNYLRGFDFNSIHKHSTVDSGYYRALCVLDVEKIISEYYSSIK